MKEKELDEEIAKINSEIEAASIMEKVIDMKIKRLDTRLTSLQKELEQIEKAESEGIEKNTPKFHDVG